jgi:hypothetical protein
MRVVRSRVAVAVAASVGTLAACGPDLGQCDMTAAKSIVYVNGTPYYAGQALIQQSCANGQCHADSAVGPSRTGAPHGLNFDVAPLANPSMPEAVNALRNGIAKVRDEASDMYGAIDDGAMPPGAVGKRNPLAWTDANGMPPGRPFPTIDSPDGKATVRNWLACNAPVIAGYNKGTTTPADPAAMSIGDVVPAGQAQMVAATFTDVYTKILASCSSCHKSGGVFPELDLSRQDLAYAALVNKPAATMSSSYPPACMGKGVLVKPSSCEESILYQKLLPKPSCGAQMPLGGPYLDAAAGADPVCAWIKAGAMP